MKLNVCKKFTFDAAHQLPDKEQFGKCRNVHGHTFRLEITVSERNSEPYWVMDFKKIKKIVQESIIDLLDHSNLNDFVKIPTAENLCRYIFSILDIKISDDKKALTKVRLYETPTSYAELINEI